MNDKIPHSCVYIVYYVRVCTRVMVDGVLLMEEQTHVNEYVRVYISKLMYYRTRLPALHSDRTFHWPKRIKIVVGFDRKTINNKPRGKKSIYWK